MLKQSLVIQKLNSKTPTCLQWFCSCEVDSYTGPDSVSQQPVGQKGAPTNQVTNRPKRERSACQPVLDCFDRQYCNELGNLWTTARAVLLDPHSWQYGVMLNRFTTLTGIRHVLQSQGFSSFLPQPDASTLHSTYSSTILASKEEIDKKSVFRPRYISECPPASDGSHLHLDHTTHSQSHQPQSEPLSPSSLSRPSLQCYVHPSALRFPSPAHRPGQLKQYYLLNAASLLPVLALKVRDGETVLDLCSAPGGKALAIMQTATPALLCCNEPDPHRRDWLAKTLESFIPLPLSNRVIISAQDGRSFGQSEAGMYDKVLIDAPCSNDRSWLYSSVALHGEERLKERAKLPLLQAQLLRSALSAVRPGGVVVYSTCTLSSSENYAVVEAVLNSCPEAEPEDLWEELVIPFSNHFTFSPAHPDQTQPGHRPSWHSQYGAVLSCHKNGVLVVPQPGKTWGPMFLCRIRRRK
ncbi:tRNA (cytosine(34)-C(5))-methyltransferase, mitochondrial [Myripristis murdjan]|uniref:NOP2/Sun RNA methyltransferase 3 n=1 Tax=Myripristis murdjan TaxID=586833 RepID=A0A667WTL1_9TELE|nr:tRNA (cytosine(34)-C(5))-methyltransferase, mitochondrial [Myripristis murdjan]